MHDPGLSLDEECFREHLTGFEFKEGAEAGKWGLFEDERVVWPNVVMWVSAPERGTAPRRFYLRFDLGRYPAVGPTACAWDHEKGLKLDAAGRPKGSGDLQIAFRVDWENGNALYCPWDRFPVSTHPDWLVKFPGLVWAPGHTIVNYLRPTYQLLNSDEYTGI